MDGDEQDARQRAVGTEAGEPGFEGAEEPDPADQGVEDAEVAEFEVPGFEGTGASDTVVPGSESGESGGLWPEFGEPVPADADAGSAATDVLWLVGFLPGVATFVLLCLAGLIVWLALTGRSRPPGARRRAWWAGHDSAHAAGFPVAEDGDGGAPHTACSSSSWSSCSSSSASSSCSSSSSTSSCGSSSS
ncbi:hypothetical protein BJP40_28035 [Streptomyces sp. CC53]|uniref:hypothetical protein n=1 Tax=unclassified Streptomyces TaxID=2593676 RepID=UPI0008DD2FC3|nr:MULTISPECIES: hypothetical protein [unclassified Streptomyces]OII62644.1 hypothetical protein BJP40_28035 [Streptomyces sp. CC53]